MRFFSVGYIYCCKRMGYDKEVTHQINCMPLSVDGYALLLYCTTSIGSQTQDGWADLNILLVGWCLMIWAAAWQNQQNDLCAQRRLRSAWACAQSAQSLRCPSEERSSPNLPIKSVKKWQNAEPTAYYASNIAIMKRGWHSHPRARTLPYTT